MTKEQEQAIEWLENKPQEYTNLINSCSYIGNKKAYAKDRTMFKTVLNLIQQLQEENKQKDKIIDLMAIDIYGTQIECNRYFKDIEEVKQYFKKKASE